MVERAVQLMPSGGFLSDPTKETPLTQSDYFNSVNELSPFRVSQVSYEDFSVSWLQTYHDLIITPERVERFLGEWLSQLSDDIRETYPHIERAIDRAQWEGNWQLTNHEPSQTVCSLPYLSHSTHTIDIGLSQGELYAEMRPQDAERVDVPLTDGLLVIEYDKNASVKLHAQIEDAHLISVDGTTLATFENTYVSVDSADLLERLSGGFLSRRMLDALVDLTKSYHRLLKLEAIVVKDGRAKLKIKPDINPLFGSFLPETFFIDLAVAMPKTGILGSLAKSGFSATNTATGYWRDEYNNGHMPETPGMINRLLPRHYRFGLWSRDIKAHVSLHDFSNFAKLTTDGACIKMQASSWENAEVEAFVPFYVEWRGKKLSGVLNARLLSNDQRHFGGWCEFYFDNPPADFPFETYGEIYLKNIPVEGDTWNLKDIFSKIAFGFVANIGFYSTKPQLLEGGGLLVMDESSQQLTLAAVNTSQEVFLPPRLTAADINISEEAFNFWADQAKIEIMPDVWLTVQKLNGTVDKNDSVYSTVLDGIFTIESKTSPFFTVPVTYEGHITYDAATKTIAFDDFKIPVHDLSFSLSAKGKKRDFIFNGSLSGSPIIDLKNKILKGPLTLDGRLESPEGHFPFFPGWVVMQDDFSLAARYEGIIYRPGQQLSSSAGSRGGYSAINDIHLTLGKLWQEGNDVKAEMDVKARPTTYVDVPDDEEDTVVEKIPEDEEDLQDSISRSPVVVRESEIAMSDWDVFLADYGLDEEKARVMLDLSERIRDGSFTIRGFSFLKKRLGPLTVPSGCEPLLDIQVQHGKLTRFHFYFTRPLKMGLIDTVRGVYFDKETGSFRLDLVGPGDASRPMDMYLGHRSDLKITKLLLKMLPLPENVVDHLLDESKIDPKFLTDDTQGWLQFFFMALVAMGDPLIHHDGEGGASVDWKNAVININAMQFDRGARFKYGGVMFEFGCEHNEQKPDLRDGNNSIRGQIRLKDGTIRLEMATIGKLHIKAASPSSAGEPFDLMLEDGDHGVLEMSAAGGLHLSGFNFGEAFIHGEANGGTLHINQAQNIRLNNLSITRTETDTGEKTTLSTDLDFNLSQGELHFVKGSKEAHLEMEDSAVHLTSQIDLEERKAATHTKVLTVFKGGFWNVESPSLYFTRAAFTPDMEFKNSSLNRAVVRLSESENLVPRMDIAGEFDWHSEKPIDIKLSRTPAIQKLNPSLTLSRVDLTGSGQLLFTNSEFHFEPLENNESLTLHVGGRVGFNIPGPTEETTSHFEADFDNTQQIDSGNLVIGKNHGSLPLFVEKLVLGGTRIQLTHGHGAFYMATPTPKGMSRIGFKDATGSLQFEGGLLEQGNRLEVEGLSLDLQDQGVHHNKLHLEGEVGINPKGLAVSRIQASGRVYDDLNQVLIPHLSLNTAP